MKASIICQSVSHGNTAKVAQAMAGVWAAGVVSPSQVDTAMLGKFDLIAFGSGIFFGKHHANLLKLVDALAPVKGQKAVIFSTGGNPGVANHNLLRGKLEAKGFLVVAEFATPGFDTYGPLKLLGGIRRGRPNERDLENARQFAARFV
jgi:flavodoxin